MRFLRLFTLVVCTFGFSAGPAHAALISVNYDFAASGFGPAAPVDPVTGTFAVTFDNATLLWDVTTGITLTGLNIALDSAPAFSYLPLDDRLIIGGLASGANVFLEGTNDFLLALDDVSSTATIGEFKFAQVGATSHFVTSTGSLTSPAAAPEPASMLLLGTGLAGLAVRRYRQTRP
jgi:hypothetical protein